MASRRKDAPRTERSAASRGEVDGLMIEVYTALRGLAHRYLSRERPGHLLQPTALVHEAYLKLSRQRNPPWRDRTHFYCLAARAMREILVNYARNRGRLKRGGGRRRVPLRDGILLDGERGPDLEALDEALERLAVRDERMVRVVELRWFGGLSIDETAAALGISPATVKREWTLARAWLLEAVADGGGDDS